MSVTKQFLIEFNEAWAREDTQTILAAVTDDIVFRMAGEAGVKGREAFSEELDDMAGSGEEFTLTVHHVIISEDGTAAAVNGEMIMSDEDGEPQVFLFCDVYTLRDDKIAEITAYIMEQHQA